MQEELINRSTNKIILQAEGNLQIEVLILSYHNETFRFIKFTSICDLCGASQDWYHEFEQRYSLINIKVFYVLIISPISVKSVGDKDQCIKSRKDKNFFILLRNR